MKYLECFLEEDFFITLIRELSIILKLIKDREQIKMKEDKIKEMIPII
jgi:hypothetical protein